MALEKSKPENNVIPRNESQNSNIIFFLAQLALRTVVIAFTVAGAIIMVNSQQTTQIYGITMTAQYTYATSFRFSVIANSIVCGLSVLSVVLATTLNHPKSNPKNYFYLLLLDLVSLLILLSGTTAATAIGYVGKFGQSKMGWMIVCDRVAKFCDKITDSLVTSFIALVCLFLLTIIGAYKLKSTA